MKPIIGITTAHNTVNNRFFVSNDYLFSIAENGGIPIFLPPCPIEDIKDQLASVDGLLFTGGGDINPLLLGEEPDPNIGESSLLRDKYELQLAKIALEQNIPILGVCRGMQVLAAASGGKITQDISKVSSLCHIQVSPRFEETHSIDIVENSTLHRVMGTNSAYVNSLHHQAVENPGNGFIISAKAKDGIIEAIESKKGFAIGVQWHAENLYQHNTSQRNLFSSLIKEAQR